jgi:hypothetical protein
MVRILASIVLVGFMHVFGARREEEVGGLTDPNAEAECGLHWEGMTSRWLF